MELELGRRLEWEAVAAGDVLWPSVLPASQLGTAQAFSILALVIPRFYTRKDSVWVPV